MNQTSHLTKSIFNQKPLLLILLSACPCIAVTTSAMSGLGIGLVTSFVLCLSNLFISLARDFVPDKVCVPANIIIIASLATIADLWMQALIPDLSYQLEIYIPLVVISCLILGKAGYFASNNSSFSSLVNGLGLGLGFTLAMTVVGSIREMLGNGSIFGQKFITEDAEGILVFMLAPGAFITLGFLAAITRKVNKKS